MKMMLWKELRENFKWAVLALLALTLAEFYVLSSQRANFNGNYDNSITLCSSSFLLVTAFGSAAVGAALGAVQILPELLRDRWAALLHRPVSRGMIFFGKVLAGLLLYFFATTLPFLASACYVAMPGEFPAPMVPGMLLPGLSSTLFGVVFYFAALFLCLHRGRWFGTRGAILLSAVIVFMLQDTMWIWTSFLLPLGAALVFLSGAWGAMLGNGPVGNRPWPGRIALVLIVLVGVQAAIGIIEALVVMVPWPWSKSPPPFVYTQFEVTRDGQILQRTSEPDGNNPVLTDMTGRVITDERYVGNNSSQNFYQFNYLGFDLRMKLRGYFGAEAGLRESVRYLQPVDRSYGQKEIWYLLPGENYFIGYDQLSRRCVGICDQEGFKPAGARLTPFGQQLKGSYFSESKLTLFWSGSQIYALDFSERTMTPFFNVGNDTVYQTSNILDYHHQDAPTRVAVALENTIRILDDKGATILTFPYPHNPVLWGRVMITANKAFDRLYLESGPSFDGDNANAAPAIPTFLDEIDLQGNVLHSYSCLNPNPYSFLFQPSLIDKTFGSFLPFGPTFVYKLYARFFSGAPSDSEDATDMEPLSITLRDLGILFIIGLAFAVFAFRWARLAGFPQGRAWPWAIFVFLFGPAGLLTFRLTSDWPTRVICPSCKGQRTAEDETCSSCDQAWPLPPRNGTEIFEDLKTAEAS